MASEEDLFTLAQMDGDSGVSAFRAYTPLPNTGAWVYYKHKGWCYRAFNAKRVAEGHTKGSAGGGSGVYAAPETVPMQTAYSLAHSAGWSSNIAAHNEASASSSRTRRSNLARLRAHSGAKQAVLVAPPHRRHAAPAEAGPDQTRDAPRMTPLQQQYCARQGISPAGGAARPKGRLPAALRAQGHGK